MGMQVQNHFHCIFLNHPFYLIDDRLIDLAGICPFTIGIVAAELGSCVSVNYSVDIEHGYYSEIVVVHEVLSLRVF